MRVRVSHGSTETEALAGGAEAENETGIVSVNLVEFVGA